MKVKYIILFTVGLMLFACSEERRKIGGLKKNYQPFLFDLAHFFTENEMNMSFPLWFDDSIVKQKKIKQIKRTLFVSSTENEKIGIEPKTIYLYDFAKNGELKTITIESFYENVQIGNVRFNYSSGKDENGFAEVKLKSGDHENNAISQYRIYEKEPARKKFLVYRNNSTGDYLFYMLNRENWGALSIDTILSPTPQDIITLGNPSQPIKSYQVRNTVSEEHVINYTYDKSGTHLMHIQFDKFPFHYERSVKYNKGGYCTGFIDSTFSQSVYLNRKESKFDFKDSMPVALTQRNESINSGSKYFQLEHFEYLYFE